MGGTASGVGRGTENVLEGSESSGTPELWPTDASRSGATVDVVGVSVCFSSLYIFILSKYF